MHGIDFELSDGVTGSYGFNGEVLLWVSAAISEDAALHLLTTMRDKIAEGKSPFEPTGEDAVGGRIVYKLEGHGQAHYYFQSGDLVIWLAADRSLAGQALEQALLFYP